MKLTKLTESFKEFENVRAKYSQMGTVIPDNIKSIVNKYLKWPTKKSMDQIIDEYHEIYSHLQYPDVMQDMYSIDLVIRGIKPSATVDNKVVPHIDNFDNSKQQLSQIDYAKKNGLVTMKYKSPIGDNYIKIDSVFIAKPQNSDVFEIFKFAQNLSMADSVRHYLFGVALGYPTEDVEGFSKITTKELGL